MSSVGDMHEDPRDIDDTSVFVVIVEPVPSDRQLMSACFQAAARVFGVRAIEDLIAGPSSNGVLVMISGECSVRPSDPWAPSLLESGVRTALRGRGLPAADLHVSVFGPSPTGYPILREAVDHWVEHLRADASVAAARHAFRSAVTSMLQRGEVRTRFQPIVDVRAAAVVGWEALGSGPPHHHLEAMIDLLSAAGPAGLERELARELMLLARRRAGERIRSADQLLFINVENEWLDVVLSEAESGAGEWPLDRIVLEITERRPVTDVAGFLEVRDRARERGLRFALDDVGAGYAGLATLAAVNPEFIKVDMTMVRDVDSDLLRQSIVEALVHLAARIGSRVVAEGVETEAELETLAGLGVELVQGFLIGTPEEWPDEHTVRRIALTDVHVRGTERPRRRQAGPASAGRAGDIPH